MAAPPRPLAPADVAELQKSAGSDLAQLGRVSHRLAMTDDGPPLEKVLSLLLPRLLSRIGANHGRTVELSANTADADADADTAALRRTYDQIHAKLVEMLSHAMKRVRADAKCRIPCGAVLELLFFERDGAHNSSSSSSSNDGDEAAMAAPRKPRGPNDVDAFTQNLSLAFLTLGLPRCTVQEVEALLPGLLQLLGVHRTCEASLVSPARTSQHNQIAHLVLRSVEAIVAGNRKAGLGPARAAAANRRTASTTRAAASSSTNGPSPPSPPPLSPSTSPARLVCSNGSDETTGAAVYDLLLDVLLYQPTAANSNIPPPGLSQAGHERLLSGASATAAGWGTEFAAVGRLRDLKLSVLEFIAPCRRWALFQGDAVASGGGVGGGGQGCMGTARTVTLLAVASGDAHQDVAERASDYLRAHMDSLRGENSGVSSSSPDDPTMLGESETKLDGSLSSHPLLGNPIALALELLTLVLGDSIAESLVLQALPDSSSQVPRVGLEPLLVDRSSADGFRSAIMSTKRRQISEKTVTSVLTFVSARVFDNIPRILTYPLGPGNNNRVASASAISSLAIASASSYLSHGSGGMGSIGGSQSGRSRLSAARLLNSLAVRLAALYDAMEGLSQENNDAEGMPIIHNHLCRVFALTCKVLSASASRHTAVSANHNGVEAKDACYGIICTIARSSASTSSSGMVFNCGEIAGEQDNDTGKGAVSIKTSALLFGCSSHEEESLRPRATAALDALLAAYCRVYKADQAKAAVSISPIGADENDPQEPANPWAAPASFQGTSELSSTNFSQLCRSLLPLLWTSAKPQQPKASRLAAARWASELVKPIDCVSACHILCYLSGDADVTASSVAREGLGISDGAANDDVSTLAADVGERKDLPDFHDFVRCVFVEGSDELATFGGRVGSYHDFSPRGQGAALRFGFVCLLADLYGGDDESVAVYMRTITSALVDLDSTSSASSTGRGREALDFLDDCCFCLAGVLGSSSFARSALVKSTEVNHQYLSSLSIKVASSKARRLLAESCGYLFEDANIWETSDGNLIGASGIDKALSLCASKLNETRQSLFMVGEVHGAAHLGSRCVRAFRLHQLAFPGENADAGLDLARCWSDCSDIISALGHGTMHSDDVIGTSCAQGLKVAFAYNQMDSPQLDRRLLEGTFEALKDLVTSLKKYGNGDNTDPQRASLLAKAAGSMLAATTLLPIASVESSEDVDSLDRISSLKTLRLQCVDGIFALLGSTAFRKDEEISLVAGEALTIYADAYSPEGAEWSTPDMEEPEDFDEDYAKDLPPHKHVLFVILKSIAASTNPHKKAASAPVMLALVGHAASSVHKDRDSASKRHFVSEVSKQLPDLQAAFIKLLAYPKNKQLGRESCVLGLAACHGLATGMNSPFVNDDDDDDGGDQASALNERLLNAFGATTNYGGSAYQESAAENRERLRRENRDGNDGGAGAAASLMEDFGMEPVADVGGAAGMSEAALGSYREMASAAIAIGRPDVLYSLMLLSTNLPVWTSPGYRHKYNANSLLGEAANAGGRNIKEIQAALRPHLGKLIPRLLRACNDPQRDTREQMTALWVGLTGGGAESRAAITEHLLTTIDALIDDATNKLWKARVGAVGALAEVIVGRSWPDLGGGGALVDDEDAIARDTDMSRSTAAHRLLRLLRVTTRSLDDVQGIVRESGEALGRSVRALIVRLCDPSIDGSKSSDDIFQGKSSAATAEQLEIDAKAAASTVLRWLVKFGLNQPSPEGTGFCISTLLGVIDVSKHNTLQPVLPDLIYHLLMAMSGLEPAALNYLQTRAAGSDASDGYDRLERLRLQMASSGPIAGALHKCLSMIRFLNVEDQKKLIPHFDAALRAGAGFATRAAVADAVGSLCSTSPSAFKTTGHASTNPTVRLLRALYFASERERGAGARDKMAHALGSLAELAPGHSVRVLALRACERYRASVGGTNDDPAARRAAAAALRSIAVRASNQFSDGGSGDIWCKRVLPLAYLGRKDDDKKIAGLWLEVWEEGGAVANAGGSDGSDFGVTLEEKLLPYLVKACMAALDDVSWSRRVTACQALVDLTDMEILAPAPRKLDAQKVNGLPPTRQSLTRAHRRAQASAEVLATCTLLIGKGRLWTGKAEVVKAVAKIASKWSIVGDTTTSSTPDSTDWSIFGADNAGACTWIPIKQDDEDWDSLFLGDRWFKSNDASSLASLPEGNEAASLAATGRGDGNTVDDNEEEAEGEDSGGLDFGDEEKVVGSEQLSARTSDVSEGEDEVRRTTTTTLTVSGLCRLLLGQGLLSPSASSRDNDILLPYRAASLQALADIINSLRPLKGRTKTTSTASAHDRYLYKHIAPIILSNIQLKDASDEVSKPQPPLITARCLGCLSALIYHGLGSGKVSCDNDEEDIVSLSRIIVDFSGGKQPAWTVREAAALAAASLAARASPEKLRKHAATTALLECSTNAQKDRKFWRVRLAGLQLLLALVERAGSAPGDNVIAARSSSGVDAELQLMLEALLPEKENIAKIARTCLSDNEAQVTDVATKICGAISWWP